jgi:hypothetical protein
VAKSPPVDTLEYHLLLACDLGYLNTTDYTQLFDALTEVKRMLATLLRQIKLHRQSSP